MTTNNLVIFLSLLTIFNFCFCESSDFRVKRKAETSQEESSARCESKDENIVWTCSENGDQTLNITIDCLLNKNDKYSAEIWIWSSGFPIEMKALTVKNCYNLVVNTSCNEEKYLKNFNYFEIKNVSNLILGGRNETIVESKSDRGYTRSWHYYPTTQPLYYFSSSRIKTKKIIDGILPAFTTLEGIQNATFTSSLTIFDFKEKCKMENYAFKSLELKNLTLDRLKPDFIGYSSNLTNFLMDNVTVSNVEGTSILMINNTDATVKIINSKFPDMNTQFINFTASKVIFSENTFGHLDGLRRLFNPKLAAIKIKANQISFFGNTIPYWGPFSFKFESPSINILKNTFEHIDNNNGDSMVAPSANNKTTLKYLLIFSNNVIYSLARMSFLNTYYSEETYNFDLFNIFNNSIDCSCKTFAWFNYMGRHELENFRSHIQLSKWFGDKNNNRCLNLPYCTLNQVLYNFENLCEEDYTCLDIDVPYNLKNSKPVFSDMLNSLNEIETLNSKILSVLTNGKYPAADKKLIGSNNNPNEIKETFSSNELLSYQNKIYSCLVLVTCLFFIIFTYHVFTLYKKYSSSKTYLSTKRTQSETELTL